VGIVLNIRNKKYQLFNGSQRMAIAYSERANWYGTSIIAITPLG
jgi:hypothetical protein